MRGAIFVDSENANRTGAWNMRYEVLRRFAEAQGAEVVRANAYIAVDYDREAADPLYSRKKHAYRSQLRSAGFRIVGKPVRRYRNDEGEIVTKANADLDLAIDVLVQASRLDYVLLVTGDGDFARLVIALQDAGARVDVMGFHHVSRDLREVADRYVSGLLVPGLVQVEPGLVRGYLTTVNEERYFGFVRVQTGLSLDAFEDGLFLHGKDVDDGTLSNAELARLVGPQSPLEFTITEDEPGKRRAVGARRLRLEA